MSSVDKLKSASLGPRVISAAVGAIVLSLVGYFFGAFGLEVFTILAILLMVREYLRMSLTTLNATAALKLWYWIVAVALLIQLLRWAEAIQWLAVTLSLYFAGGIFLTRNKMANEQLLPALSRGLLGLMVCVLMPSFVVQLLRLPNGVAWFGLLLFVVFSGDIFAYFGGILFGKEKFMPQISPKKTIAGAITGLLGSVIIGTLYARWQLPMVPATSIAAAAALAGFVAQMGDLLMSLVKRVAQVKDSGSLMPGHGGILDRVDGIIVSAPLIFALAYWFER